ncbi:MAG: sigma-70 family RNA polymerase sigma factor [Pirellulales bacterium]|nr:sigma-70 family RNA polymerase sigma factor [Pirellulales bacterium]
MNDPAAQVDIQLSADEIATQTVAFETLFQHFHPRLVRFLAKLLDGSTVDPEDVAQESMVKAWTKRDQFDPRYRFSTWVYAIARRTAADHLRKQRRLECSDQLDSLARSGGSPDQSLVANEAADDLWSTAERVLSPRQYAALWLRYGEEMSVKEVAKTLSKSTVSTRVLLHRARVALQSHLGSPGRAADSQGEGKR